MSYVGGGEARRRYAPIVAGAALVILTLVFVTYTPTLMYFSNALGSGKMEQGLDELSYPTVVYIAVESSYAGSLPSSDVVHEWVFGNVTVVEFEAQSYAQLQGLAQYPWVLSIYAYSEPAFVPNPLSNLYTYLASNEMEESLEIAMHADYNVLYNVTTLPPTAYPGNNITVCIIDSGIDYLDPDLRHAVYVLVSFVVTTGNGEPLVWIRGVNGTLEQAWAVDQYVHSVTGHYAWMDDLGHGTMVAGIIASSGVLSDGMYMGLTPDVRLVVIKAFNSSGIASVDTILNALEWVYENAGRFGIKVCSFSWGIPVASNGEDPVSLAVESLVNEGIVVVAAAGNDYLFPYTINVPASAPGVIAVGAWDPWLHTVAIFSSAGPTASGEVKPTFVAPGVWITSDIPVTVVSVFQAYAEEYAPYLIKEPGYMMLSGTSFATPYVAAMAVKAEEYYYLTHHVYPTPSQVLEILREWAVPVSPAPDIFTGYGLLVGPH